MSTHVVGHLHPERSFTPTLFADITPAPWAFAPDGLLFDATLSQAQQDAIVARMTSRNDADEAARANLTGLRDAAAGKVPANVAAIQAAVVAVIDYLLGES